MGGVKWAASWAAAMQGPAPCGVPAALPDLSFALPHDQADGQSMRMVFRPDLWGKRGRLRFSNAFGAKPVTFSDVFVGLHATSGAMAPAPQAVVTFGGATSATVAPGAEIYSDPFDLTFVDGPDDPMLAGRKLAATFHLPNATGPMTWHAKAMTTTYIAPPKTPPVGGDPSNDRLPYTSTGWYFLDGFDVEAPEETIVVAAIGDSITDGTFSTLNENDRWTDFFSLRLKQAFGAGACIVNVGIGGNQVVGPAAYAPERPFEGGPSALDRLDRDILSRSGVTHVVWMEGVNDFG